jgi:hypothetical protein
MSIFSRKTPEPAETSGDREQRDAREAIVSDLASRIDDRARADQVRALPGGDRMVTEAIERSARNR